MNQEKSLNLVLILSEKGLSSLVGKRKCDKAELTLSVNGRFCHGFPCLTEIFLVYHGERARYHYFQCLQLLLRMQITALTNAWQLPPEFEVRYRESHAISLLNGLSTKVMCRDIWALHLSLLPNPPPAEPYLYALEQAGQKQSDASPAKHKQDETDKNDASDNGDSSSDRDSPEKSNCSSSPPSDGDEDSELERLLRENSEAPSSSEDEEQSRPRKPILKDKEPKSKDLHRDYDSPAGNISVLMLACWTLRLPVMYMDFVRFVLC